MKPKIDDQLERIDSAMENDAIPNDILFNHQMALHDCLREAVDALRSKSLNRASADAALERIQDRLAGIY